MSALSTDNLLSTHNVLSTHKVLSTHNENRWKYKDVRDLTLYDYIVVIFLY